MTSPNAEGTVHVDNRVVAVAARLGRYAATVNRPLTSCPYGGGDDVDAALRRVWLTNYLRVRPPAAGTVDYDGDEDAVDVAESAGRVVVLLETGGVVDDEDDDEPFTVEEYALFVALGELDGKPFVEVFDATQARYPKGHPKGGQWRPMADRIKQSIEDHRAGKHGDKHPLEGYNREQLRKVAKARGIALNRGEDRDSIAAKLLADHGPAPKIKGTAKVKVTPPPPPPAPKVPEKPAVSPELAKRIKEAAASLPKTKKEWTALIPERESMHEFHVQKLDKAKAERDKAQAEHDAVVAQLDELLKQSGMRRKDTRAREMKRYENYQRSKDRVEWAQKSVDTWQNYVDNPGFSDYDKPYEWPRDPGTGRIMPAEGHNRHLDTVLGVGTAILDEAKQYFDNDPEIKRARQRYDRKKAAQREAEILREMMASVRSHGDRHHDNITLDPGDGTTRSQGARADAPARIRAAEGYFPDDWVAMSNGRRLNLTSTDRAYYSDSTDTLAMDTAAADSMYYDGAFRDYTDEVNVHELGHRMEYTVPGLTALEFAFVRRRSTGPDGKLTESPRSLGDLTGHAGYSSSEVAFEDEWMQPYAGKTYEGRNPSRPDEGPWEVFQVGLQDTYGRSTSKFDGKTELQAFTLGALATLGTA